MQEGLGPRWAKKPRLPPPLHSSPRTAPRPSSESPVRSMLLGTRQGESDAAPALQAHEPE